MKKIFSILLLALTLSLFTGCFFIVPESEEEPATYSFYFKNDTDDDLRDWYLIDRNGRKYSRVNDGFANAIAAGETHSIKGLVKRDYKVFYENKSKEQYTSGYFNLDSDKTYIVSTDELFRGRL